MQVCWAINDAGDAPFQRYRNERRIELVRRYRYHDAKTLMIPTPLAGIKANKG